MLRTLLGTKVGMTQLFKQDRTVVPATAIKVGRWIVTQIKTQENDGYNAIQVATPRDRYKNLAYDSAWLKKKKDYFLYIREISNLDVSRYALGQEVGLADSVIAVGDLVHVTGTSIGLGFQGGIKRHGFSGGPASHGSSFHRKPGAVGHRRTHGEVDKGKRLPGHTGCDRVTVRNLEVVRLDASQGVIFVKGAVPGKSNFFVTVSKRG